MGAATRGRRAFTLIELAITLGVLAILAALVLPSFQRQRDQAARSACMGNLKQLGIAALQYVHDYDGCAMAPWYGTAPTAEAAYTWRFALAPYARSQNVFLCPREPAPRRQRWSLVDGPFTRREFLGRSSYGANTVHADPGGPTPPFDGRPRVMERGSAPAATFLLVEVEQAGPWLDHYGNDHGYDRANLPGARRHVAREEEPSYHHIHGAWLYLDGHVGCGTYDHCPNADGGHDACAWSLE